MKPLEAGKKKEVIEAELATGGVYNVVFEKTDRTIRAMTVTTNLERIPKEFHPKGTSTRAPSPTSKSVWAINDNSWKSFRYEFVRSFVEVLG